MRFIHQIFTAAVGRTISNEALLAEFEPHLEALQLAKERYEELRSFVQYCLVGQRQRNMFTPDLSARRSFAVRAQTFEDGAQHAIDDLAAQIAPVAEAEKISFDAVLTTTSTGNLMPGLSYRLAQRLANVIPSNCLMIDLGNAGCTGSLNALNLARALAASFKNILVVTVELPSTLADLTSTQFDVWQGNCTFGDGAAALWISSEPESGAMALSLEELRYCQQAAAGFDLIRWGYRDYYTFTLADEKTFNHDVRSFVMDALRTTEADWKNEPRWAIHPAGVALLVRLARKLGIPGEAMQPSLAHYRHYSNMSSASLVHIIKDIAAATPPQSAINLLTMGAGFNVIYGRVRKVR